MYVNELSENEFEELRETLFFELLDKDKLDEAVPGASLPYDIPDNLVTERFGGIHFVEEDFFCNLKD